MQLSPRENFTIVRQIEDHTDSTVYFVRAFVRNAKTDTLLATVNLTHKGDQRYSADYLVPVDGSGQGFWISIVTAVYTDAGYTTKSGNYGDNLDTYLVQERYNMNISGGSGGSDIDYKKVRQIIKEEVAVLEHEEMEMPEMPSLEPIMSAIKGVYLAVTGIEIPKQKETDLKPVLKSLTEINKLVDSLPKEIPEYPKTDLSGVLDKIEQTGDNLSDKVGELKGLTESIKAIKEEDVRNAMSLLFNTLEKYRPIYEPKKPEPIISPISERARKFMK